MLKTYLRSLFFAVIFILVLGLLGACSNDDKPKPTIAPTIEPSATEQLPSLTPTYSGPSTTPSRTFPPSITPLPASTTPEPLATALPTDLPAPIVHVITQGQTCSGLANLYNTGIPAIVALNDGLDCRSLQIGASVLIPHATPTPSPVGFDLTATAVYLALPTRLRNATPFNIYSYCAEEGDTLTSIALKNGTTSKRICELNTGPDGLDCRGCDFTNDLMGDCSAPPVINQNKCYNVPGATYTPTFTPTFSGQETATPTPTHLPPSGVLPIEGATISGRVQLVWAITRQLNDNESFLVSFMDENTGESFFANTQTTSYTIPSEWEPTAGQSRQIVWSVEIVIQNENGLYVPVGGASIKQRFTWQAR